jgi:hypothetical protein
MGWLGPAIGILAALTLWDTGHPVLLSLAIISSICCFWSWGIMHNYATEMAKLRSTYRGVFSDFTENEVQSVPNWIAGLNMLFTFAVLVLLIIAVVIRFV